MTEKTQGALVAVTSRQIDALTAPNVKVELFVSSRLGVESTSYEVERDRVVDVEEGEAV